MSSLFSKRSLAIVLCAICIVIIVCTILGVLWLRSLDASMTFRVEDIQRYNLVELETSPLISRTWMIVAIDLQKKINMSPSRASRLYAYTASVFADTLAATDDLTEASAVTARILFQLVPDAYHPRIVEAYTDLHGGYPHIRTQTGRRMLDTYAERIHTDGHDLTWSESMIPHDPTLWYVESVIDDGARSGEWMTWIADPNINLAVPPPPQRGSIRDSYEVALVTYSAAQRIPAELPVITFWHAAGGTSKTHSTTNLTPAAVWQNILYREEGATATEEEYAHAQKIVAQSIADSFIFTWREKYTYYLQRPSMRNDLLALAITNPPFPSYTSGHSTISKTAAVVLSALYPEKSSLWHDLAEDAKTSRLISGIHFDMDNTIGAVAGERLGNILLYELGLRDTIPEQPAYPSSLSGIDYFKYMVLRIRNAFAHPYFWTLVTHPSSLFSNITFNDTADDAGLPVPSSNYTMWFDYDNDDDIDLYVGSNLFAQEADGTFTQVTDAAGLAFMRDRHLTTVASIDFDGNGCRDIFGFSQMSELPFASVAFNNCDGTFSDMTYTVRLPVTHPTGIAFADYNNDGLLDVYIANWPTESEVFPAESNDLWRNTGNGTFTRVTTQADVSGLPNCPNYPPETYPLAQTKFAFQPIWFDYNMDGHQDVFVATDTWISPLYKNNGDGTFTDVTYEAGLCRPGTGMGVAITDLDNNGFPDLYVTNTGKNYLWMNHGTTFTEESEQRGVDNISQGWATFFQDFDNDGDDDLYVVNGSAANASNKIRSEISWRNLDELFENDGTGHFTPVTHTAGIYGSSFKQSAAIADYNKDGRVDIYVSSLGLPAGTWNPLYTNTTATDHHWITLYLTGTPTNPEGIGASVTVTTDDTSQTKYLHGGGSFFSQDERMLHFGLGDATTFSATVLWPDGTEQTIESDTVDRALTIVKE